MTSEAQKVPAPKGVVLSEREATLAEFEDYLRTVDNRDGCPYEERSIEAYVSPGKHLDKWLTSQGIDGDFTATDTAHLNRYFREYFRAHGQGGTHTLQRNLIQLYNFLQRERDHPSPYTDGLNRYAPVKGRPKTLGAVFVDDLLEVTGGGRARDFETARDHAIIRILRSEGIRRAELLGMVMHTLPADVIKTPCSGWCRSRAPGKLARGDWCPWPRPRLARLLVRMSAVASSLPAAVMAIRGPSMRAGLAARRRRPGTAGHRSQS
jgi:hypothetical protein